MNLSGRGAVPRQGGGKNFGYTRFEVPLRCAGGDAG